MMPGLDRTGPQGRGPMTGGGFGNCKSANSTEVGAATGSGGGRGLARGRGRGNRYRAAENMSEQKDKRCAEPAKTEDSSDSDNNQAEVKSLELKLDELSRQNDELQSENEELRAASSSNKKTKKTNK